MPGTGPAEQNAGSAFRELMASEVTGGQRLSTAEGTYREGFIVEEPVV